MTDIQLDPTDKSQRESPHEVQFLYMGLQDYRKAEEWQAIFLREIRQNHRGPTILGLEHPPTISLGRRANADRDILWSQESLERHSMRIAQSERGGQATLHTPGQLVIYPLLHLDWLQMRVKDYVCFLTQITLSTLKGLGVETFSKDETEPGLFTKNGKIASFGLRIEKGVSSHGLSINNTNELHLFGAIRACGVSGQKHARIADERGPILQKELFDTWGREFVKKWHHHRAFPLTTCDEVG